MLDNTDLHFSMLCNSAGICESTKYNVMDVASFELCSLTTLSQLPSRSSATL